MKLLRIIASMNPFSGGPCQGIRNSIPEQEKLGVYNEVVSLDDPNSTFIGKDSFIIHALGPVWGPYAYSPELKKWLKNNLGRFDVVIIHGVWLYNSYGSFRFWNQYKEVHDKFPQLYLMPHGMLDPYFQKARERKFKALRNLLFWQFIERKVINGADGLLFTCEQELLLARKSFKPYNPKSEINLGYGVQEPPPFEERHLIAFKEKCPGINDRPFWLFLSRIHPKKGVDLLIKAYLRIKKEFTNIPDLLIAGPGIESPYGQFLKKLDQGESVQFCGMLEGDAKWGAFYQSEVFVLPSHQENFGIAVVEAMACGKAVIISDQVNIWREIKNGNGGLISEDTEEGVYLTLKEWQNFSKGKKEVMGENARQVYLKNYTTEKAAIRMIEAFQKKHLKKEILLG